MSLSNPVFIPGPTNLPDSIRRAIDLPTVDHRSPAFAASLPQLFDGLKQIVGTTRERSLFSLEPEPVAGKRRFQTRCLVVIVCWHAGMGYFPTNGSGCVKTLG